VTQAIDYQKHVDAAQARSDASQKQHELAAQRGQAPEQRAARQTVVINFFELHLPKKKEQAEAYLQQVDLSQPVCVVNAAGIDTAAAPSRGLLGVGKRPQYLVSEAVPPADAASPVYALRSMPAR